MDGIFPKQFFANQAKAARELEVGFAVVLVEQAEELARCETFLGKSHAISLTARALYENGKETYRLQKQVADAWEAASK